MLFDKKENDPSTVSMAYKVMQPRWHKIETLLGGTEAMREAGHQYLPQHAEEGNKAYAERLSKAVLYNVTKLTLENLVGKPFSAPVVLNDDVPEQLKEWLDDVDLQGNNIDVFAREWFREGVAKCYCSVLIDLPRILPTEQPRTLADDEKDNIRPYALIIKPENIIFAHRESINGKEVLTHIRIREEIIEKVGFAEVTTTQIRVLEPGLTTIYREKETKSKKTEWVIHEQYETQLDFIPLVTFYADRQEFMVGEPPLTSLADLNIRHWQSQSEQDTVLTVARFPMLAASGVSVDSEVTVGPNELLLTPDSSGRFYYVEHSGRAIAAGREDLKDLEDKMSRYGTEFLRKRPGRESATARALDSAEATSALGDMITRFIDAAETMLYFMALLGNLEQGGTLSLQRDFGPEVSGDAELNNLTQARQNRDISRETYLAAFKARGILPDNFDLVKDAQLLEEELEITGKSDIDIDEDADE